MADSRSEPAKPFLVRMKLIDPRPTIEVDVEARSPGLALKIATVQHPSYEPIALDGVTVLGRCRQCGRFILDGDECRQDPAGLSCEGCP